MYLRQSTGVTRRFGPFLDSTDGVTPETGLTIAQADMQLSKAGAAFAQKAAAGNATHDTDGWYSTTIDAADTDTVGELILQVTVAGALPVWLRWFVLDASTYDALFAASPTGFNAQGQTTVGGYAAGQSPTDAIVAAHLDHLFQVDYDPTTIPGVAGAWANELTEDDGGGQVRYTRKALEQAPGGVTGLISDEWKWDDGTAAADPGSGMIRGDNATQSAITNIYANEVTEPGNNRGILFSQLSAGDILLVEVRDDGSAFIAMNVTGPPVDNGGWWTIPVSVFNNGNNVDDGKDINLAFVYQSQTAGVQDWTNLERENIRSSLGVNGTKTTATGGHVQDIQSRLPAALVGGRMNSNVESMDVSVVQGIVDGVWDEPKAAHITAGTFGVLLDVTVSSRAATSDGSVITMSSPGVINNVNIVSSANLTFWQGVPAPIMINGFPPIHVAEHAAAALTEIQDVIVSDSTTFPGATIVRQTRAVDAIGLGTCAAGATSTVIPTSALDPAASVADQFMGRIMTFDRNTTTAGLRGKSAEIVSNTAAGVFTVTPALTATPVSGDTFTIQ